jgi:hypothetical protein
MAVFTRRVNSLRSASGMAVGRVKITRRNRRGASE